MKTIVYIDDDLDDISFFQEIVSAIDKTIVVMPFSDSMSALEHLDDPGSEAPNFIFLDINMPLMNGKETLLLIRRNRKLTDVPVVIYSTALVEDIKTFQQLGATNFLQKSIKLQDGIESVAKVLN